MKKVLSLLIVLMFIAFCPQLLLAQTPPGMTLIDDQGVIGTSNPMPVTGLTGVNASILGAETDAYSIDPTLTNKSIIAYEKGLLYENLALATLLGTTNTDLGTVDTDVQAVTTGIQSIKETNVPLFGGAVAASVTEANSTVIDMRKSKSGSLDFLVNSGTGTWSIAIYTSETGTGVFHLASMINTNTGALIAYPAIATTASTSGSFQIPLICANYLKFVPTLTGTCNATFTFTPCR